VRAMLLGMGAVLLSACGPRVGGELGFRVNWSAVWRTDGSEAYFIAEGPPACGPGFEVRELPVDCAGFQEMLNDFGKSDYSNNFKMGSRHHLDASAWLGDSDRDEFVLDGVGYQRGCSEIKVFGISTVLDVNVDGDQAQVRSRDYSDEKIFGYRRIRLDLTTMYCELDTSDFSY